MIKNRNQKLIAAVSAMCVFAIPTPTTSYVSSFAMHAQQNTANEITPRSVGNFLFKTSAVVGSVIVIFALYFGRKIVKFVKDFLDEPENPGGDVNSDFDDGNINFSKVKNDGHVSIDIDSGLLEINPDDTIEIGESKINLDDNIDYDNITIDESKIKYEVIIDNVAEINSDVDDIDYDNIMIDNSKIIPECNKD